MKKLTIIQLLLVLFILSASLITSAQKQPQIQEVSVRAPDNIKIDGKLTEWANQLLNSFNSTARIYYVVSNDDNNLYLTIRGLGNGVAKKALAGGLTFTISHAEKKNRAKAVDNVAIKFPLPQDGQTTAGIMSTINQLFDFTDDSVANRKQIDSIVKIANNRVNNTLKEIGVIGVKDIPDSVVSIYNTQGIKAAAQFIKIQLVIEIAIPLKYLNLSVDNPAKFSYNIKLDAIPVSSQGNGVVIDMAIPPPMVVQVSGSMSPPMPSAPNQNAAYAWNSTDFWGEYILVKK